jgi:hypothetical protein
MSDFLSTGKAAAKSSHAAAKQVRCPHCSQMTPAEHWPAWGDRAAFYNQTPERTVEEPGAARIELDCRNCGQHFYVVWDHDPRPAGQRSPGPSPTAPSPHPPNDALRALISQVDRLAAGHPRAAAATDPKLDQQIPWITRTLREAAEALETGADPFGNPITSAQITHGLRTLASMVTAPSYLAAMETGYPGITPGLHDAMTRLDDIISTIDHPAPSSTSAVESAGVATLVELCTEEGILFPSEHVARAIEELETEGEPGSIALADLIRELITCRSACIVHALEAARHATPTTELVDAVQAAVDAPELAEAPPDPRFVPEIVGEGRCGWTTGTHLKVTAEARWALAELQDRD